MSAISLTEWAAQTQDKLQAGLAKKITNVSTFAKILRFIPVLGFAYPYSEQTTLGSIAWRGLNEDYSADSGAVNPKVENLRIFGGEVDTDRLLIGGNPNDPRSNSIAAKIQRAGLFLDAAVIDGNSTSNNKSFDGLNKRLINKQVITAGTNGAALTLAMVDDMIDRTIGPNETKHIITNKFCRRKIKSLVLASAGGAGVLDVGGSLAKYDGVTIDIIDEDGDDNVILGFDETVGSSAITASIYCVQPGSDTEQENLQGLIKIQQNVAPGLVNQVGYFSHSAQGERGTKFIDLIEAAIGIALFHGRAATRVKGILAT